MKTDNPLREANKAQLAALRKVARTQAAFWEALAELESLLGGSDLDGTKDYTIYTQPTLGDLDEVLENYAYD